MAAEIVVHSLSSVLNGSITGAGLATGGGAYVDGSVTITVPASTADQAYEGTDNTTAMTPLRVKEVIDAIIATITVTVYGKGYLGAFHNAILSGDPVSAVLTGDSTTFGAPGPTAPFVPSTMMDRMTHEQGIDNITWHNRGHGGASSAEWIADYIDGDLELEPQLMVIRYGVVDPKEGISADEFEANMREGLTQIRDAYSVDELSIVLCTPNTSNIPADGRTPEWFESLRPILRSLAAEFHCCFLDVYAIWPDAANMGEIMDDWDGGHLHPLDGFNVQIWSEIFNLVIPTSIRRSGSGIASATTAQIASLTPTAGLLRLLSDAPTHPKPVYGDGDAWRFLSSDSAALPAAYTNIIDAFTTPPTAARKALIYALYEDLVDAGIWAKLDLLYLIAAADSQAARVNWINPGANTLTVSGTPTFTADRGYTGNGVDGLLSTGAAQNSLSNFSQDSASAGFWCLTNTASVAAAFDLGLSDTSATFRLAARNASGSILGRMNDSTNATFVTATSQGLTAMNRSGASAREFYRDGVSVLSDTAASTALGTGVIQLMRDGGFAGYSNREFGVFFVGESLTAGEHLAAHTAFGTYLDALGAI